jgi:peptide/nickel transport system substrate-binding protein
MKRPVRFARVLSGVLAVALMAVACGSQTNSPSPAGSGAAPGSPGASGAAGAQQPIAKIRARIPNNVASFDPYKTSTFGLYVGAFVGGLWQRQLRDGSFRNDLAESVTTSPDGLTYTLVLKDGVTYSDGTPVKSEDGKFAIENHIKNVGQLKGYLEPYIASIDTPDAKTMVVHMKSPLPIFLQVINTGYMPIYPKAKVEADPDYFQHPDSAGPYIVAQGWVPNTPTVTLTENPKYVGGPMMIKEIEFVTVADVQSTILQTTTGALDWATDLPMSNATGISPEVQLSVENRTGIYDLKFNMKNTGPIGNPLVRQAIGLAINRQEISQRVWYGEIPAAESFLYHDLKEFEPDVLPNKGKQDLDGAKALLAQTPWPTGFDMNLITWAPRDGHIATAQVLSEQLKKIGINVTIDALEIQAAGERLLDPTKWDAFFQGTSGYPAGQEMVNYTCPESSTGLLTFYQNPEACTLARSALLAPDVDSAKATLRSLYAIMNKDVNVLPLTDRGWLTAWRFDKALFGYPDTGLTAQWSIPTVAEWAAR